LRVQGSGRNDQEATIVWLRRLMTVKEVMWHEQQRRNDVVPSAVIQQPLEPSRTFVEPRFFAIADDGEGNTVSIFRPYPSDRHDAWC